jgi:hypothetical protein
MNPMMIKMFLSAIPKVGRTIGMLVLVLNIILPGIGSILAGIIGGRSSDMGCVVAGVLQLLTAVFIVGWIWSIWWGVQIYQKSRSFLPV